MNGYFFPKIQPLLRLFFPPHSFLDTILIYIIDKRQNFFLFRSKRQLFFNKIVKNELLSFEKHPLVFSNLNHSHLKFTNPKEIIFFHLSLLFDYSFPLPKISVERGLQRSNTKENFVRVSVQRGVPTLSSNLLTVQQREGHEEAGGVVVAGRGIKARNSNWARKKGWGVNGEERKGEKSKTGPWRKRKRKGEAHLSLLSIRFRVNGGSRVPDVESCRHIENSSCLLFSNFSPPPSLSALLSFSSFFLAYSLA